MGRLRSLFRLLAIGLSTILGTVVLYFLLALALGYFPVGQPTPQALEKGVAVFVRTNGVHTDFIVPVRSSAIDWSRQFPYSDFVQADSTFQMVAFGWGDKGFYLDTPDWADLKFSTAFNALFWRSTTAMHVTYLRKAPVRGEGCRKLWISQSQYQALIDYVGQSFQRDEAGQVRLIAGRGYGSYDNFYEAVGTYSFLRTCNVWTGRGLQIMGVRTACWSPFDQGILYHLPAP
jgi:uncharacterized protein (TIGR02117 family)